MKLRSTAPPATRDSHAGNSVRSKTRPELGATAGYRSERLNSQETTERTTARTAPPLRPDLPPETFFHSPSCKAKHLVQVYAQWQLNL